MKIIGCDLHARQQTLAMLDTTTGEPSVAPAKIIQVFKQRVSRQMRGENFAKSTQLCLVFPCEIGDLQRFWQRRYYDFNVYSRRKLEEKLEYMHANPMVEK